MEDRAIILRDLKICRFCLTEKEPLKNIYVKDKSNAIPLPLQIMACVALEVFSNDGMPQMICDSCCIQTQQSYNFKSICKRSDDALKLYLATGMLKRGDEEVSIDSTKRQSKDDEVIPPKRRKTEENPSDNNEEKPLEDESEISPVKTEVFNLAVDENNEIILEKQQNIQEDSQIIENQTFENEQVPEIEIQGIIEEEKSTNENNYPSIRIISESGETGIIFEEPPDEIVTSTPVPEVKTHCFSCDHCERSFPLQQLLEIHMRQHTRERKFACTECDKKFFSKHDLNKHSYTHSGTKPFICVVCDKAFSRATLLHRHEKIHVAVPKYLCTYCERTFLTSEDLDAHMTDHKKSRPFQCKQCDKKFAFKQGVERHELSHINENAFKCNYCSESFSTSLKLQRHITTHAGGRPFPCKLCPRTFVLSHHLSRHMRSHYSPANKPGDVGEYKCDVCSMSFKRKYLLVNHSAIHSMVNLKCVICNKEFEDAETVKEHISTHLGGSPYICYKCEYTFENEEDLIEHEQKHYESDSESDTKEDLSVPEVVEQQPNEVDMPRRSQREKKAKAYVDFLKVEDFSDSEENYEEENSDEEFMKSNAIQPVVRAETIKVYKGKDKPPKTDVVSQPTEDQEEKEKTIHISKKSPKITTLENLGISQSTLDAITDKSGLYEMKIGQKIIRVQKLMMTKAEVQAMSQQGKLDLKGCKVLVKNSATGAIDLNKFTKSVQEGSKDENLGSSSSKNPRTYVKKLTKKDTETTVDAEKQITNKKTAENENVSVSIDKKVAEKVQEVISN